MNNMSYKIINNLPIDFCYNDYDRKSLKGFSDWFFNNKSERIAILVEELNSDHQCWSPDYTRTSLDLLAKWLSRNIEKVPLTASQYRKKRLITPSYIDIQEWRLSDSSLSRIFDVGVYFGEMMIYHHHELKWEQYLKNKKNNDYGHMIINMGNISMNPIWLVYIQALKIVNGIYSETCLSDLYETWCDFLQN